MSLGKSRETPGQGAWMSCWTSWEQRGKGTTPACFPIFLALFLTVPQTNKQTSVQAQCFNHCLMFLHSGIFCSWYLHFHPPLGPAQGSFRCPKGHDAWVLLFHISMQYVLANFLLVEFLSKYTVSPWRARIIPVNDSYVPFHWFLNHPWERLRPHSWSVFFLRPRGETFGVSHPPIIWWMQTNFNNLSKIVSKMTMNRHQLIRVISFFLLLLTATTYHFERKWFITGPKRWCIQSAKVRHSWLASVPQVK